MMSGAITAIVTPMDNNGKIDYPAFANLLEFQIKNKISGIVVGGSTGEAATLSIEEKLELVKHAVRINQNRVKIIMGVSSNDTSVACGFTKMLNDIVGIDYILVVTPYYVKPTQEGLFQHFARIAKISNKPLILYNVPSRTGCDLQDETTLKLANDFSNIIGLKDATGDISRAGYLIKNKPEKFKLYSGDDITALAFMLGGGDGVISVVSNIVPKEFSQMCEFALNGDKNNAIKLNNKLFELHKAFFIESNPIPIKWALFSLKIINTANLRLPLTILTEKNCEIIKRLLDKIVKKEENI